MTHTPHLTLTRKFVLSRKEPLLANLVLKAFLEVKTFLV